MRTPSVVGKLKDSGAGCSVYGNYAGRNHTKYNPHRLHNVPVVKRIEDRVLDTVKQVVVGGSG